MESSKAKFLQIKPNYMGFLLCIKSSSQMSLTMEIVVFKDVKISCYMPFLCSCIL